MASQITCIAFFTLAVSCCLGGILPAVPAAIPAAYSIPYASSYSAHAVNHAVAAPVAAHVAAPLISAPAPLAYSAFAPVAQYAPSIHAVSPALPYSVAALPATYAVGK